MAKLFFSSGFAFSLSAGLYSSSARIAITGSAIAASHADSRRVYANGVQPIDATSKARKANSTTEIASVSTVSVDGAAA